MKKTFVLLSLGLIVFSSCKKNYNCVCTNSSGSYTAGDPIEARTKYKANKECKKLSGGSTTCEIK